MSRIVLVPHGVVPTGIGVVLDRDNKIKLTTPCCGNTFYEGGESTLDPKWSISAWCSKCKLEWTKLMFDTDAVLFHTLAVDKIGPQEDWLARALGVPRSELQVTVE